MHIWEHADWPDFRWDAAPLLEPLGHAHRAEGLLLGQMTRLAFGPKRTAEVDAIAEEALQSSAIEGEAFDRASVRSSVARHLGVPDAALAPQDRRVEGIVSLTLDATKNCAAPLTRERMFGWHAALFPTGYAGMHRIIVGDWRDDAKGPMQVVSGRIGAGHVHYTAPPAARVAAEMAAFLDWFEQPRAIDGILHAAIAHLWFVTIHPFDDGNGRIARALADMSLARSENAPHRFYSLASAIRRERSVYYDTLERTQKGGLDITQGLRWFIGCFTRAIEAAAETSARVLDKADFWQRHAATGLNERQIKVLNRLLDGFVGGLTVPKWGALTGCSAATAQRDIKELQDRGLLIRNPGGSKNTSYRLAENAGNDLA